MPRNEAMQSVQRAIQILYAVAGYEGGRTIGQIAGTLNLKPNTIYRFIKTLEQEHLLQRKKNPLRFTLGEALSELKRLDDERHLLSEAGKVLIRTQIQLPEANFALLELHGTNTFQRLCVESNRTGVLIRRREYKVDFYSRASSLLFLAYSHPDEAELLFRAHPFEHEGKPIWKSRARLNEFLEKTRRIGWSEPEFPDRNFFRVAVPIFTQGKEIIAALGGFISMDESEKIKKRLVSLSRDAAKEIMDGLESPNEE